MPVPDRAPESLVADTGDAGAIGRHPGGATARRVEADTDEWSRPPRQIRPFPRGPFDEDDHEPRRTDVLFMVCGASAAATLALCIWFAQTMGWL